MFSYYLQNRSYYYANDTEVIAHILELNTIMAEADESDHFFIPINFEEGRYDRWSSIGDFLASGRVSNTISLRVWPSIKKRCKLLERSYMALSEMNLIHLQTANAFLGPLFYLKTNNLLTTYDDYILFRRSNALKLVNGRTFGKCCSICLDHVFVTRETSDMVEPLGSMVVTVFNLLLELNAYINHSWISGDFNERDVSANTTLTITDESDTVKQNPILRQQRYFRIPDFGGQYCFLHIKKGNLRIHIFADSTTKRVFVPYIGPHLST